ncbi:TetR/AcrR family transcriptional regulator [Massilia arenae]|uniref:TetR/AcrR family transcriptional regulator n=1 Tax=Massilia arenae TaxID=2603288 RepID=A0A5C7FV94_9BURK|nr:TetR/AcrR family transcriptional regulator [Massilia arenae]TXF98743.1 TetR/AcrR family transcriptional regulator [Massilia arenae]
MARTSTHESSDVRDNIVAVGQRIMAGKGFSAVGLNEILVAAGVPKGSFYHYFGSKDAFGEALLAKYFEDYLADMDRLFQEQDMTMAQRLVNYFASWRANQSFDDCQGKCLAVKLGAEVADLSEPMRLTLKQGTSDIVARLAYAIEHGAADGSLAVQASSAQLAESLYQLWLGASLMAKIVRDASPFDAAMNTTQNLLNLPR